MAVQRNRFFTPDEYLQLERQADFKSEFLNGEIFAIAVATEAHNTITSNVLGSLVAQLKGRPCRSYGSDMRIQVSQTRLYTYADVVVVCGVPKLLDNRRDTLLNPTLIVEVLSPSTEAYDRGEKTRHYRTLESLREMVLISQDRPHIGRLSRARNGRWVLTEADGLASSIRLSSIGCTLALADVYDRVEVTYNAPGSTAAP